MSAKELQATPCWQGSHRPVATASIGEPRATVQASPCDTSSSGWSLRQRRGHPIAASRGARIGNRSRRLGTVPPKCDVLEEGFHEEMVIAAGGFAHIGAGFGPDWFLVEARH